MVLRPLGPRARAHFRAAADVTRTGRERLGARGWAREARRFPGGDARARHAAARRVLPRRGAARHCGADPFHDRPPARKDPADDCLTPHRPLQPSARLTRVDAVARAAAWVDDGRFAAELAALVAIESESQTPEKHPELRRYLTDAMAPRLAGMGFSCAIHDNPDPTGGPLMIAARREGEGLPTILSYGHGDVIRAQTAQWRDGLTPFRLVAEGERLYGRGTADNKGQHLINIAALEAVLATRGHLGFNVTLVMETSEECGSCGLAAFFEAERAALAADVLIASDGPRLHPDTPTLFMGSRGAANFTLSVTLREGAHHSGNWGGLLADPAIILAHAIASVTDRRGRIAIPEWRPTSLTPDIRAALAGLPVAGDDGPAIDENWGEADQNPAERAFGWNSFAVLAMSSGVPEAPVNAISASASATCQLRFVVGTDEDDILPALRRHLDREGFAEVRIEHAGQAMFHATRLSPEHPWVRFAAASLEATAGKPPHILPNLAGSLPNECFSDILGLPTIWVPHSYRACCQHAPNEHVIVPLCRDAARVMAGLWWDVGVPGATPAAAANADAATAADAAATPAATPAPGHGAP